MLTPHEETMSRRGLIRYEKNPFLGDALANTRSGVKRITNKDNNSMMLVSNQTGEVIAPAGFWKHETVDRTQFVKLYINGVKAFKDLTGAGTKVFEVLYTQVQNNVGNDVIYLSFSEIDQRSTPMSKATYMKGMKELIVKGFIAESIVQNKYFLNPDFMFNGDRLAFVTEYFRKPSKPRADTQTLDLFAEINELDKPQDGEI